MSAEQQSSERQRLIFRVALLASAFCVSVIACVNSASNGGAAAGTEVGDGGGNLRAADATVDAAAGPANQPDASDASSGCRMVDGACVDCACGGTYGYRIDRNAGCYELQPVLLLCRSNDSCAVQPAETCRVVRTDAGGIVGEYLLQSSPVPFEGDGPPLESCVEAAPNVPCDQ